jgi:hypothetical protein
MKEISVRSSVHPVVLSAFDLIRQRMLSQYPDAIGVFNGIYGYVKRVVRFEDDDKVVCSYIDPGANAELLITPERLLTMPEPKGDCDDFSMLLASLVIASQEICKVYFVTVAADHNAPDEFSHVYVAVQLPSQQTFVMDGSHGPWFGWEVQNVFKKRYWEVFER